MKYLGSPYRWLVLSPSDNDLQAIASLPLRLDTDFVAAIPTESENEYTLLQCALNGLKL